MSRPYAPKTTNDFERFSNQVLHSSDHKFKLKFQRAEAAAHVLSDKDVRHFLRKYYYIANGPALDKEYGDLFTEDGVFIMGNKKATGREAIRNLRKKVWEEVPNRDHDMVKVFSHGNHDDDTELMTLGTATWTYHEGHQNVGDWAAHVKLEKDEDGKIECSYYQIIMDHSIHDRKPEHSHKLAEKEKAK